MSLTKIIKINPANPEEKYIVQAAKVISGGGLAVIPTETVYGIAANSLDKKALERLYEIKKRAADKPFSLLIAEKSKADELAGDIPVAAYKLMHKFWPGPLTIILKGAGEAKVGLRMPDHPVALKIIEQAHVVIACPSANVAGEPAPDNFAQAIQNMDGLVDLAVDAGPAKLGQESTVVDLSVQPLKIIRSGAIKDEEINAAARSKSVLFVCMGNSCRSVMAEAYLKKLLEKQNRKDVEVSSAGIMMLSGLGASEGTREVLKKEGIDVGEHHSQKATKELVERSDIILVMERSHEDKILQLEPRAKNRLFLLKEFANPVRNTQFNLANISNGTKISDNELDIPDPLGASLEFYEKTFATIKDAVERIMKIL